MLVITVPAVDYFDDDKSEFVKTDEVTLQLEHSLVSLSKWESKYEKPFLTSDEKSDQEMLDYIKFMTLTPNIPEEIYQRLSGSNYSEISNYMSAKMSATWFTEIEGANKPQSAKSQITAELIYYWMIALNIPFTCEEWHINRLFTLIKVCNEKNAPAKKMSPSEIAARNRRLNAERQAKFNTKG